MSGIATAFAKFQEQRLRGANGRDGRDGIRGARGQRGEQGFKGDKGESIKGDKGDPSLIEGQAGEAGKDGDIGPMPKHESRGDAIRFETSLGSWGKWINLASVNKGQSGGGGLSIASITQLITENTNLTYNVLIDNVSSSSFKYIGESDPSTAEATAKWRIKRIDQSDTGGDVDILWGNGVATFTHAWSDRLTLTYTATGL